MMVSNMNLLFQGPIFRGYVSFREGILPIMFVVDCVSWCSFFLGWVFHSLDFSLGLHSTELCNPFFLPLAPWTDVSNVCSISMYIGYLWLYNAIHWGCGPLPSSKPFCASPRVYRERGATPAIHEQWKIPGWLGYPVISGFLLSRCKDPY